MANTELGKAYVQIVPSAEGIGGSIASALEPGAKSAGTKAGSTIGQNMGSKISSVGKKFIKVGAIASAVSVPVIASIKDSLSAYEVQATAESKLTEIYKTRMGVGDKAVQSTKNLASALQQEGVIGDEVALSGAQQLATFAKYPSTINTLLPAMNNLLAQQKGVNATTGDAVNIGNLMGKVMQGQTGALTRVGISFTEAQEKILKYGTEEEKAATLAEVITSNVGNMNKTLADTPAGKMAQLNNSLGDMKESIGAALAPVVADLATFVSEKVVPVMEKIIKFIQEHPVIGKITIAIAGLLAVGGLLLVMLDSLMTILPMLGTAFTVLTGPVGLVIAAIAAAIAIGVLLYKNWDKIKAAAGKLKDWVVQKFTAMKTGVVNLIQKMKKGVSNAFKKIGSAIKTIVKGWFNIITWPYRKAWEFIKKVAGKIKDVFDFDFKMPHIPLPHFHIDPPGWELGDLLKGVIPGLSIDWYAKGGIFDRPSVIGVGEAGPEGVIPLNPFWNRMDAIVDAVQNGGQGGDININVYGTAGMDVNQLAAAVEQRLVRLQKQREVAHA